ncbi:hypothetical protein A5787_12970 [Mycobacterium sp. 852002-50816_SCH5313054-b]|uniref:NmrA family NAD(P)-binding protein n=1 Tax=Mycobacterium sp. 852002-50816_SCH5313054-b TaxID=1834092 RepID=UPI0007FE553F|nr:NmrA family NAD(P)-binding protein [Mycobacterium sp. 852002-50816_SCH5313054-b]OBF44713.1 hypothetical protein A5787_12970 [Mycobacterium sp. 852002-50816_SCH5313054-b]
MPSRATSGFWRDGPVTVIGATGQRGGAVVEALLNRSVPVRSATRNLNGDKTRALAQPGVEVVVLAGHEDLEAMFGWLARTDGWG